MFVWYKGVADKAYRLVQVNGATLCVAFPVALLHCLLPCPHPADSAVLNMMLYLPEQGPHACFSMQACSRASEMKVWTVLLFFGVARTNSGRCSQRPEEHAWDVPAQQILDASSHVRAIPQSGRACLHGKCDKRCPCPCSPFLSSAYHCEPSRAWPSVRS